jgi:Carboxypeptidase regulatory-like domain
VTDVAQDPLSGVCVDAGATETTTAADGTYALSVPAGTYPVGFDACSTSQNLVAQSYPTPITVADGQTVPGIDAHMQAAVRSRCRRWTPTPARPSTTRPSPCGVPAPRRRSPSGAYLVEAVGDSSTAQVARSWYPASPDPAHAQLVEVGTGQTVDLPLAIFHGATISGTVTGAGRALAGAQVAATIREPDGSVYAAGGALVEPDGQYTATGIAPGHWTITADAGRRWVPQARSVQTSEAGASSLDFRLPRGPAVDGRRPVGLRRLHLSRRGHTITVTGRISERRRAPGKVTISFGHLFPGRHTIRLARFTAARGRFAVTIRLPRGRRLVNPRLFVDIDENHAFAPARFERRLPHR